MAFDARLHVRDRLPFRIAERRFFARRSSLENRRIGESNLGHGFSDLHRLWVRSTPGCAGRGSLERLMLRLLRSRRAGRVGFSRSPSRRFLATP